MPDKDPSPWYSDGLRFTCTGCGDCCTGAPGYVWVNKAEIAAIAELMEMQVAKFEQKYVRKVGVRKSLKEYANGDCVFFDNETRKCNVYSARPRQCRTWPFWDSNLRTPTPGRRPARSALVPAKGSCTTSTKSRSNAVRFVCEAELVAASTESAKGI